MEGGGQLKCLKIRRPGDFEHGKHPPVRPSLEKLQRFGPFLIFVRKGQGLRRVLGDTNVSLPPAAQRPPRPHTEATLRDLGLGEVLLPFREAPRSPLSCAGEQSEEAGKEAAETGFLPKMSLLVLPSLRDRKEKQEASSPPCGDSAVRATAQAGRLLS